MNVEQAAQMLEKWAELRLGYLTRRGIQEPTNANEIDALDRTDLMIWAEAEGFRHAAQVLRDPAATMSIPTWLEPQWEAHLEAMKAAFLRPSYAQWEAHLEAMKAEIADSGIGYCGPCGHPWDWHGVRDNGACIGAYCGLPPTPCDCRRTSPGKDE